MEALQTLFHTEGFAVQPKYYVNCEKMLNI